LGDNIFYGHGFTEILQRSSKLNHGGLVFGYPVQDPERYGVVEFNSDGMAIGIEEKPVKPKSQYAVPGIYFYDGRAPQIAKKLKPSPRGELEITDLNLVYLREGSLRVEKLGRGFAWLDTGTHDSLLDASDFIATIERRQGLKVGCIEEIAFRNGWISRDILESRGTFLKKNDYGKYLLRVAKENS
jgi:glucose-1-phosphate thymidylyltransferase